MFKTEYAIAFAYPSSTNAEILGFPDDGCHYVQCTAQREDGSIFTAPVIDAFGVLAHRDPAIRQHLKEWKADEGPARTMDAAKRG